MNHENEMSVLGAGFMDVAAVDHALSVLTADDFALDVHRRVFEAFGRLRDAGDGVDVVSVSNSCGVQWQFLTELMDFVPTSANISYYCKQVKKDAGRRRLMSAAYEIIERTEAGEDAQEWAETEILGIRQEGRSGPKHIKAGIREAFARMEKSTQNKGEVRGVKSGIQQLDLLINGFEQDRLYIVAGRPGMGKSSLAQNVVEYAAIEKHVPALVFNLEMGQDEIAQRSLCSQGRVDSTAARIGLFQPADLSRLNEAADRLHRAPIWIDDTPGLSIAQLQSRARRQKSMHDIGLVVVDYLQLVKGVGQSRQQEIGSISRGLKCLAKELHCPVVALSQLNRSLENRENKRPIMADLREAGDIEQDADVIIFCYRDAVYNPTADPTEAELIIAKQRGGPTGKIPVRWIGQHTRFEETQNEYQKHGG